MNNPLEIVTFSVVAVVYFLHFCWLFSLAHLQQANPQLFTDVINNVHEQTLKWSNVLLDLQKRFAEAENFLEPGWEIKVSARIRFTNLPENDIRNRSTFPTNDDTGRFVQIKGKNFTH